MFKKTYQAQRGRIGLLLISPWLMGLILLKFGPILASFAISLTNFEMVDPEGIAFIGLENYFALLQDDVMWAVLFSTISLALVTVPLQLGAAIFLAALLSSKALLGRSLYRTLIFLPSIIPTIAVFSIWAGFLDPATGWLNRLVMKPLNLPPYTGINSESGSLLLLILLSLWNIGPSFLILSGAMLGVPDELYEAARVDGAGPLYRLIYITLPVISPAIFFSLIITLIMVFGGSVLIDRSITFAMGAQSPIDTYIGSIMFGNRSALGYAASVAWAMSLLVIGISIYLFRTAERWVYYPLESK